MRDNAVTLLVGGRGRRKTTYLKQVIWKLRDTRRIVVVDTFDSPVWRHLGTIVAGKPLNQEMADYKVQDITIDDLQSKDKGVYRIFSTDTSTLIQEIQRRCTNCLVIIEDATRFIEGNITPELKKFVLDTKQINVDLIMVFHALKLVPPKLSMFSDFLTLFKTQEKWNGDLNNRFPQPGVMEAFMKLQQDRDEFKKVMIDLRA